MKNPYILIAAAVVCYLVGMIVTFGHAWNSIRPFEKDGYITSAVERSVANSFGCAIFWPFYWSAQLWQPSTGEAKL